MKKKLAVGQVWTCINDRLEGDMRWTFELVTRVRDHLGTVGYIGVKVGVELGLNQVILFGEDGFALADQDDKDCPEMWEAGWFLKRKTTRKPGIRRG